MKYSLLFTTGTGKTFVGVKLLEIILRISKEPVLLLCYTNHAVDSALLDLIELDPTRSDIVRLGGRSKSQEVEPFMLRNLKQGVLC